jgi:regulatory protein
MPKRAPKPRDEPVDPEVPDADPEAVGRKILLRRLTDRPRSRVELAESLAKRDVPEEIATRLLDRFEEVGLVDDEAFARTWVQTRMSGKGLSRRALGVELRRKGVGDEVIRTVLDEIDGDDEVEAARRLVRRKLKSTRGLDAQVRMRRLAGMLGRKGYPPGLALRVVRDELAADDADVEGVPLGEIAD